MAVSTSTGVMNSLLSKLSKLLSDQYKQRKGLRRDVEFLRCELTDMNAVLEKLADMEKLDVQIKVWRDKVREMAYDTEDCIDIFMHRRLSHGDDNDGLFHKIARKIRVLREYYHMANKIKDLRARVEGQSQSRDRYTIHESVSESTVLEVDPRLPALFEDAKRLVGIDGPQEEITKWLMEEGDADSGKLLKVVSIVGFGGIGKTTLANQVYTKIKNEFECTAFVSVSRTPDIPKILKDILCKGVGYIAKQMEDDVQKLIEILRVQIKNKRFLIIIDDLWSTKDWCTIKCAFVENNNGSRVITTTRHQDIASACCFPSRDHVYFMQPLDVYHSRRLFFKRLFDTEDDCPGQFREILNDMLRKCKGVPLAITSIASLLANKNKHVEAWEKICNSLGSELDTNPTMEWMRHVLTLSYNDLSHELKTCFLHLGTYPEDSEIHKFDLLRKWIAEGFIRVKHGLDLEEAAENCLNELINRSMIEPCLNHYGEVWGCRVHDLMLDLITLMCKAENFITIIDSKFAMNGALQVRRVSHQFNNNNMAMHQQVNLAQIRSYNSFPMADCCVPPLLKFEVLRILDMDQGLYVGPQSLCLDLSAINHLFLLRYFRVSGFRLELPKKFGELRHLLTLDMSFTLLYPSDQLSDFTSLSSLRHLNLPRRVTLGNGLSKLYNLRSLDRLDIGTNSVECIRDLGELTNLRELTVRYSWPGDVEDNPDTILAASLDKLVNSNLRGLHCVVKTGGRPLPAQFWSNCLTRPRHLHRLRLGNFIPRVPNWMTHACRLAYLNPLKVQELRSDDIQVLAQLPCLICLRLVAKTFPDRNLTIHPDTFLSLKYFDFCCELSRLTFEPAAMPRLQRLITRLDGRGQSAMQLQEGFPVSGIEHLANLEKILVDIRFKYGHNRSKTESACRDAISKHPRSQDMQIYVECTVSELVEEGLTMQYSRSQEN